MPEYVVKVPGFPDSVREGKTVAKVRFKVATILHECSYYRTVGDALKATVVHLRRVEVMHDH